MEDFKNLSYYDQLREIERQLVKLQDSYRRISNVPQSQPMDLISDLQANPPNFQSIEPIEGVLESPHTESICDSMEDLHGPWEEHRDRVVPAPSTQEPGSNLGANSEEQNCEMVYSSTKESIADLVGGAYYVFDKMSTREIALPQFSTTLKKPIFSCQKEDSTIGADEDRQIQYVSSVEESSPSKTGEDLNEISTTIDTSENSVCLTLESELGREDREVLSPSTEKTNSEFKEGNSKYSEFDLIDLDGNELSSWMRNCEEWESRALVGYLSFRNLHLHPLDADNNVDTRRIQSMLMKQHLGSAHEVFEIMSKKEIVHVVDSIGLLITLRGGFGLIGSTSSFVFDPGKGLELSSHLKESRRS